MIARSQHLYDLLPDLADRHTAADLANTGEGPSKVAYERLDAAYRAHIAEIEAANLAILRVPIATPDELLAKLEGFLHATAAMVIAGDDWRSLDLAAILVRLQAFDWTDEFQPALTAVARDLARLGPPTGRRPRTVAASDRKAWDQALARFQAAQAAHDVEGDRLREAQRTRFTACPAHLKEPGLSWGVHLRWPSRACLDDDPLLTPAERMELAPALESWLAHLRDAEAVETHDDDAAERIYDAQSDAFDALMATRAPDPAALALKQALTYRDIDDNRLGYDDLGLVAFHLDEDFEQRCTIEAFRDTLGLAGQNHPVLHLEAFSGRRWIAHFEAAGGCVSFADPALLLVHPQWESGRVRREAATLLAELEATPWKLRAVLLSARKRQGQGGDPIFDAHGNHGAKDLRGGKRKTPHMPPARLDRILFHIVGETLTPMIARYRRENGRLVEIAADNPRA